MATTLPPQISVVVPARSAATAWLNAFLATSQEESRPLLNRTILLEFFEHGLQLVCTDGTVLLRTWAPTAEHELDGMPHTADVPDRAVVVIDREGFGAAFMKTLLKVTNDDAHAHEDLTLNLALHDEEATVALGAEFMRERLTLRACGQRIDLLLFEDDYPNWRALDLGVEASERVDGLTVAPRMLAMIGKLKDVSRVDLAFHGEDRYVEFTAWSPAEVRGVLAPMRRVPAPTPSRRDDAQQTEIDEDAIPDDVSVTIEGGGDSITMSGAEFKRAARNAGRR